MTAATLRPVRAELCRPSNNGELGYVSVEAYEVFTPEGQALQPHMRKAEAAAFCRAKGWTFEVKLAHRSYAPEFNANLRAELADIVGDTVTKFKPGDRVWSAGGYRGTVQPRRGGRLLRVRWDSGFESHIAAHNLEPIRTAEVST